jgi:hypothetical protein
MARRDGAMFVSKLCFICRWPSALTDVETRWTTGGRKPDALALFRLAL